ncbi:MAG: GNAT family N-acetyltransferase [Acidobacteria bacterium]|nr:GNAT family N-acetyltransferase [Acidobacteriota bacterium]
MSGPISRDDKQPPSPESPANTPGAETPQDRLVRRATLDDLGVILDIENACFAEEAYPADYFQFLFAQRGCEVWLAEDEGGVPAGTLILVFAGSPHHRLECRIGSLAVRPEAQGKGLGRRLMGFAEERARRRPANRIRLEVRSENRRAIRLYESLGFRRIRPLPHYYGFGRHGILFMKLL